jgi:predicted ATPase
MDLPTGSVTLLFTDIEGSTRLIDELGEESYLEALAEHRRLLRAAFSAGGGVEVDTQGDAFLYAFDDPAPALAAAAHGQHALENGPVRVRMGIHTAESLLTGEGYGGRELHRAARIAASGHGGQVVVSAATQALVDGELTELGEHRLKDFDEPVPLFQLGSERFPPLKTISNTNLPRPASSFVGRTHERDDLLALVRNGSRLVTLFGPGGSGKTRLAIEVASELVPGFKAGVIWVGLSALRDPALVTQTIAQTLGAKDGLAEHVSERELLLLLDNFEHIVEAAAELSQLLEACPRLSLLVTSRELLRIAGEVAYPVSPLAESEAVELFCERARLDPDETILELRRRLDDMPLALELAAARTRALTPAQILDRLGHRLDLFKGGRDADPRQLTLRATIEWSLDLLTDYEKQLFARLAVFTGGCTLDASEDVCDADLDRLQSLIDKSLLRHTGDRFWMLETIREFAWERLKESGEADDILERLGRYLVALAEAEGAPHFVERQADAFARLELEHPNVRAVAEWAVHEQRHERALTLIAAFWQVWVTRHPREASGWVNAAVAERRQVSDDLWIAALMGAGEVARFSGDLARAIELKEMLLRAARAYTGGDPYWELGPLVDLADIALQQGDFVKARAYAEQSLALRRERGVPPARALGSLGEIALAEGDLDQAEALFEEAARGFMEAGHDGNYAAEVGNLGEVMRRQGHLDRARGLFTEALERFAALGDEAAVGECLQDLAVVANRQGENERAARLWGAGEALRESSGNPAGRRQAKPDLSEHESAQGRLLNLAEAVGYALGK